MKQQDNYIVELRHHTEDGDYFEEDHCFFDRQEAISFARANIGDLHAVYYYPAGTDCNPKTIHI